MALPIPMVKKTTATVVSSTVAEGPNWCRRPALQGRLRGRPEPALDGRTCSDGVCGNPVGSREPTSLHSPTREARVTPGSSGGAELICGAGRAALLLSWGNQVRKGGVSLTNRAEKSIAAD